MSLDFSPYRAVLLDLDGTIYHEDHALPGAIELIRRLQKEQKTFACITNSTLSPIKLTERLMDMGVEVEPDQIYSAAAATCDYVLQRYPVAVQEEPASIDRRRARVFNLSTESVDDMLYGSVDWVTTGTEPCDVVICGAPTNTFATPERCRIALELLRNGSGLVGICADRVYPSPRGIEFGVGSLTYMLAYASGIDPVFCGKPETIFFQELCDRLGVDPSWCVVIGDNLESDIVGGKSVGMRTILTLSGITRESDLATLAAESQPDLVITDLRELM